MVLIQAMNWKKRHSKIAILNLPMSLEKLKEANFFIVAVPTPVDKHNVPDLVPVQKASNTMGKVVKKGDYIVFESTVYPGCTEEDCLPEIEKLIGLESHIRF